MAGARRLPAALVLVIAIALTTTGVAVGLAPSSTKSGDFLEYTASCGSVIQPDPLENERPSTLEKCHEILMDREPIVVGLVCLGVGIAVGFSARQFRVDGR